MSLDYLDVDVLDAHKYKGLRVSQRVVRLTNPNTCISHTIMKPVKNLEETKLLKEAARLLGRMGGRAGTGKSKARPSDVCRKAVMKRWDAWRKARGESDKPTSMSTKPKAQA